MTHKVSSLREIQAQLKEVQEEQESLQVQQKACQAQAQSLQELTGRVQHIEAVMPPDRGQEIQSLRDDTDRVLHRQADEITETRQWLAETGQAQQDLAAAMKIRAEQVETEMQRLRKVLESEGEQRVACEGQLSDQIQELNKKADSLYSESSERAEQAEVQVREMQSELDSVSRRVAKLHSRMTKAANQNEIEAGAMSALRGDVLSVSERVEALENQLKEIIGG